MREARGSLRRAKARARGNRQTESGAQSDEPSGSPHLARQRYRAVGYKLVEGYGKEPTGAIAYAASLLAFDGWLTLCSSPRRTTGVRSFSPDTQSILPGQCVSAGERSCGAIFSGQGVSRASKRCLPDSSDEEAIARAHALMAKRKGPFDRLEVWEGSRFVFWQPLSAEVPGADRPLAPAPDDS